MMGDAEKQPTPDKKEKVKQMGIYNQDHNDVLAMLLVLQSAGQPLTPIEYMTECYLKFGLSFDAWMKYAELLERTGVIRAAKISDKITSYSMTKSIPNGIELESESNDDSMMADDEQ